MNCRHGARTPLTEKYWEGVEWKIGTARSQTDLYALRSPALIVSIADVLVIPIYTLQHAPLLGRRHHSMLDLRKADAEDYV